MRSLALLLGLVGTAAGDASVPRTHQFETPWPAVLPCGGPMKLWVSSGTGGGLRWASSDGALAVAFAEGRGTRLEVPVHMLGRLQRATAADSEVSLDVACPGDLSIWWEKCVGVCQVSALYPLLRGVHGRSHVSGEDLAHPEVIARRLAGDARALIEAACDGGRCSGVVRAADEALARLQAAAVITPRRVARLRWALRAGAALSAVVECEPAGDESPPPQTYRCWLTVTPEGGERFQYAGASELAWFGRLGTIMLWPNVSHLVAISGAALALAGGARFSGGHR